MAREKVRDFCAVSATWWWWWWYQYFSLCSLPSMKMLLSGTSVRSENRFIRLPTVRFAMKSFVRSEYITSVSQELWNIFQCASLLRVYLVTEAVWTVVIDSIVILGALTPCALLHPVCDLKSTLINAQRCLIRALLPYESEMSHKAAEASKRIYYAKGENSDDQSTVTRKFLKNFLGLQEPLSAG